MSESQRDAVRIARHVHVCGRVQGVGFRAFAHSEAERQGLAGWVRNLPDGRVEAWAEGTPECVDAWLQALKRGPAFAQVDDLQVEPVAPAGSLEQPGSFRVQR